MFTLEFNPTALPRTMTRAEWRKCHRWLRTVARIIRDKVSWA